MGFALALIEPPKADEIIFALKTFTAAMVALWLAFWLGLDNPYWAMATVFIVSQPLAAPLRSKALYRFGGTFMGGVAAVILVPNLADAPLLLSLALAIWIGLCLYISLLDRSPRSYLFMLAGYTAGIIGFPAVGMPGDIFQTALTRVEEISLGIVCTTVIGVVILPRPLGPVLAARIVAWARPAILWAEMALDGKIDDPRTRFDRQNLAAEAADIGMLTAQLSYDTSPLRAASGLIEQLRLHVLSLMPILSSIGDRVHNLQNLGEIAPALQTLLNDFKTWVSAGPTAPATMGQSLRAQIFNLRQELRHHESWAGILRMSLLERLSELLDVLGRARAIHQHVLHDAPAPQLPVFKHALAKPVKVHDHGLALLSAFAAALSTLLVCWFWIITGWASGSGAAVFVAVACSFFAAQDDPVPAIAQMLRNTMIAAVGAAIYTFAILPRVETFPELCLVLLPAALVVGVLVSRPASFGTGMLLGAVGSTILGLNNGYKSDIAGFINGAVALVIGVLAALAVTQLIRSIGAELSARRLLQGAWEDIATAAGKPTNLDRGTLSGAMLDRLGALMPRLASVSPSADVAAADLLRDLRVGLNVIELRRVLSQLPANAKIEAVLADIEQHYRGDALQPAAEVLQRDLDHGLQHLATEYEHTGSSACATALTMLVGLRSVFFKDAAPPEITQWGAPTILVAAQ